MPEAPEGWCAAWSPVSLQPTPLYRRSPRPLPSAQAMGNRQAMGSRRKRGRNNYHPSSLARRLRGGSGWIPLLGTSAPARQSPLGESRAHWWQSPLVRPRGGNGSPRLPALQVVHHLSLALFYHTYVLENSPSHKVSSITHGSVPAGP